MAPKPYLQTVDATVGTGAREVYPVGQSSILPNLRMAYTNAGGSLTEQGYQLGFFLVEAHYTVRGRRAIPLTAPVLIEQWTDAKRMEFFDALTKYYSRRKA